MCISGFNEVRLTISAKESVLSRFHVCYTVCDKYKYKQWS